MGNNIKQIRKSLGISVTELAQRLNMSQGNLTKIENGQVDLRLDTAQAIAEVLQCPLERIMEQEREVFVICHSTGSLQRTFQNHGGL